MKPIVLLLSAICIALMCVLAYYSDPMRAAGFLVFAGFLAFSLAYAYLPAWRGWAYGGMILVFLPVVIFFLISVISGEGRLEDMFLGLAGGIIAFAVRLRLGDRAKARDKGIPYFPGDERKSDEELASNADIKFFNRKS